MCHVFFFDCPVFPVICTTVRDGFVQISFKSVDRIVLFVTFPDIDKDFLHDIFSHLVIFHSAFCKKDKVTIKLLKEFMIKGFALDDERLKQGGTVFGKRYFDELLERIREIRASERMFYQKLTDIFAQSYDYDKTAQITFDFYSSIQNKLEYAVIGQTAAEIIIDRADSRKEHMGLKTWRDVGKGGKIQLSDTYVAKNYMTREELSELNQLVNICLDNAELSVKRGRPISMQGWVEQVNAILSLHGYTLLTGKGTRSSADAKAHAKAEYEKFRPIQDEHFVSDFDKMVAKTLKNKH